MSRRVTLGAAIAAFALLALVSAIWWNTISFRSRSASPAVLPAKETTSRTDVAPGNHNAGIRLDILGSVPAREVSDLLRGCSQREVIELAGQLQKLRPGPQTYNTVTQFFKVWAEFDSEAAFRTALSFSDPSPKSTALRAIFDGAPAEAAGALTNVLKPTTDLAPMLKSELLAQGIGKWSQADAPSAARFLDENPDATIAERRQMPTGTSMIANTVAGHWAETDPQAAMEWAKKRPDASSAMQGAIGGWWQTDPDGATAYVMRHLETNIDHNVAAVLADLMAAQDPKRAAEWVAQLPNDSARSFSEISIAHSLGSRDPQAAVDWAGTLPPAERTGALTSIIAAWAYNDPQAAGQWASTLTGPGRDETIATYGSAIASLDPPAALGWTMTVNDQRMRDESVQRIISVWINQNPAAAKSWIEQSTLSLEQKARLLNASPGP